MWLLVQGWLLRNVLTLMGDGLAPRPVSARFSSAPGRPAALRSASSTRAVVLAIAALAGWATERSDGARCPPVVAYSREFLARAANELDSLPLGSAIEQMLADYQVMREQGRCVGDANSTRHPTQGRGAGLMQGPQSLRAFSLASFCCAS